MSLRQLFLRHIAQTSDGPKFLEITKARGIYVWDKEGNSYIDLNSGFGVSAMGHQHPEVLKAIHQQVDAYLHTTVYGEFVLAPQVQLAKLLVEHLPEELNCVYFGNSGSEAIEGAMKLAKRTTGRHEIIACRNAYHGSTQGADSLMDPPLYTRSFFPLLPGIKHIDYNSESELSRITDQTAAVVLETVQGEAGVQVPKNDYLKKLKRRCNQVGALLVFDEIQVGLGRTGKLFAFEHFGIEPDILALAKALGGGMPIGAFIANKERMDALSVNPALSHITTFGGHPVSCAAGLASLNAMLESNVIDEVEKKASIFRNRLKHPLIREIRGIGLMLAVDLGDEALVYQMADLGLKKGILIDWFLFNSNSFRLIPPLTVSENEVELICELLIEMLNEIA